MKNQKNKTIHEKSKNSYIRDIRNYLAGKATGITEDESLMNELIKYVNCKKLMLEENNLLLSSQEVAIKYRKIFNSIKSANNKLYKKSEELLLDPDSIQFIDSALDCLDLANEMYDPLRDIYQVFGNNLIRGNEGQFFTPEIAINFLVESVNLKKGDKIIDPACGTGSFLAYASSYLKQKNIDSNAILESLFGIEKDSKLSNLASQNLNHSLMGQSNIFCGNSLERMLQNNKEIPIDFENSFDVVLANPPFGSKITVGSPKVNSTFDLSYKWDFDKNLNKYFKTDKTNNNPSIQVLFLELCIKLLKEKGRMGIVLPESMLSNASTGYVVQYFLDRMNIEAVIGMPEDLFKTSGKGGTHTKTCLVIANKKSRNKKNNVDIFLAEAKYCGHDSRGNLIDRNDVKIIQENFFNKKNTSSLMGYFISQEQVEDNILVPRFYNPIPNSNLNKLKKTHHLYRLGNLVKDGILSISTGDEVGKSSYSTGNVPFIRTSDISNWEIKVDPKHCISNEIYESYSNKQDVKEGDILMVKDGTYLIGSCAFVSKYDEKIVYQSHLYKLRLNDNKLINPYLLIASLSSKIVIDQIQAKRFTQDIIDSLGKRIYDLVIPIPKDNRVRNNISKIVKKSINDRINARELAKDAKLSIVKQ
jgi:type I restriction enzyme M protein